MIARRGCARSTRARSQRVSARPSMSGMRQSLSTRSKRCAASIACACAPPARFLQHEAERRQQAGEQLAAIAIVVDQQHRAAALGRRQAAYAPRQHAARRRPPPPPARAAKNGTPNPRPGAIRPATGPASAARIRAKCSGPGRCRPGRRRCRPARRVRRCVPDRLRRCRCPYRARQTPAAPGRRRPCWQSSDKVTLPRSMNFRAFDNRLSSTWRSLAPSSRTSGGTLPRSTHRAMPCSRARMRTISSTSSSRPFRSTGPVCSCMRPASIFDNSRISLIRVSKWWPARLMMARFCFSSSNMLFESAIICEKPITEFKGVRNSWLMLARKTLFARLADCASVTATDSAAVRCCTRSSRWSR